MLKVKKFLHSSLRVPVDPEVAKDFYGNVLGLEMDTNRPDIPGLLGQWWNVGATQIHVMCRPKERGILEEGARVDISDTHIALAVEDLSAACKALASKGIKFHETAVVGGRRQVFFHDPAGNLIELQQA